MNKLNKAVDRIKALERALESDGFQWNPIDVKPTDTKPAYLLAFVSNDGGADWYYRSAYWHRFNDRVDDDEIDRYLEGEFEWFQFYGGEPHPFDATEARYWCAIYKPGDPDEEWAKTKLAP